MYHKLLPNTLHSFGGFNFAISGFLTSPPLVSDTVSLLVLMVNFLSPVQTFPLPQPWVVIKKSRKSGAEPPSPSLHSAISCFATGDKPLPLFRAQPVPVIPRLLQGWGRTST